MPNYWVWRTVHLRADVVAANDDDAFIKLLDIDDADMEVVDVQCGIVEHAP